MKKHDVDAVSLAFGLGFLGFAVWWQLILSIDLDLPKFGWLVGGALILFGALGLLATVRSEQAGRREAAGRTALDPASADDMGASGSVRR